MAIPCLELERIMYLHLPLYSPAFLSSVELSVGQDSGCTGGSSTSGWLNRPSPALIFIAAGGCLGWFNRPAPCFVCVSHYCPSPKSGGMLPSLIAPVSTGEKSPFIASVKGEAPRVSLGTPKSSNTYKSTATYSVSLS